MVIRVSEIPEEGLQIEGVGEFPRPFQDPAWSLTDVSLKVEKDGDTVFVTVLRTLHGKPFWIGDANHTSHRLLKLGFSQRQAVLLLYLLAIGLAVTAILISTVSFGAAVLGVALIAVLLLLISLILAKVPFAGRADQN